MFFNCFNAVVEQDVNFVIHFVSRCLLLFISVAKMDFEFDNFQTHTPLKDSMSLRFVGIPMLLLKRNPM